MALIMPVSFAGCITQEAVVSDFNMIFKYGVAAKNELNTFSGTYTKDMIMEPSITANMTLSQQELDIISRKMIEIDFIDYPDIFSIEVAPGEAVGQRIPYPSYFFRVEYNSQVKELFWEDKIINESEEADRLRELIRLIIDIIEAKEEYQNLPSPKGGYI
jgi:hypothetical protein